MDLVISVTSGIPDWLKIVLIVFAIWFLYMTRPNAKTKTVTSWSTDYPEQQAKRKAKILNPKEKTNV